MIGLRTVLGIIPARGGSKALPQKNIRPLYGKPLITWTIEAALKSVLMDSVIVTTDSQEIAEISRAAGATVPFIRPDALATDHAPTIDVVSHAIAHFSDVDKRSFDYVVLLEPTSPLREDDDVDNMLIALDSAADRFDSIISVGEVREHPSIMKRLSGPELKPFCAELPMTTRRQDNEPAFFPYGVAYVAKTASLLKERTFYTSRSTYFRIKRYQTYEIDDLYDFLAVENVMKHEMSVR